jgi:hypothetical protein
MRSKLVLLGGCFCLGERDGSLPSARGRKSCAGARRREQRPWTPPGPSPSSSEGTSAAALEAELNELLGPGPEDEDLAALLHSPDLFPEEPAEESPATPTRGASSTPPRSGNRNGAQHRPSAGRKRQAPTMAPPTFARPRAPTQVLDDEDEDWYDED